jgi:hypothetical protein
MERPWICAVPGTIFCLQRLLIFVKDAALNPSCRNGRDAARSIHGCHLIRRHNDAENKVLDTKAQGVSRKWSR